ncbi:MAG: c-type cytochrome [Bdellovibrionales bacterium]|nr:c-type cytochrome [Bdellovibrionales bacterium]
MLAKLIVLSPEDWENWKRGKKLLASNEPEKITTTSAATERAQAPLLTLVEQGKAHFNSKGCVACHSPDGSAKGNLGPALKGIYGAQVELISGSKVMVDENYLRESIENPVAKIVKGYNPVMPTFKGQVSELEMNALIAFIKSLK